MTLADINIERIIRRHSAFHNIEIDKKTTTFILDIVRQCLKINNLTKKERDKKFEKIRRTMN